MLSLSTWIVLNRTAQQQIWQLSMDLYPVFETARMYRGRVPDLSLARTYGITTFELG
jgi:hypothetical protein